MLVTGADQSRAAGTRRFCSVIFPGPQPEANSLLLAESLRAMGGDLSGDPVQFLFPDFGRPLADYTRERLQALDVELVPFQADIDKLRFFFMGQVMGLALAEERAEGQTDLLIWLDANTIIVREPGEFLLPEDRALGYCPVHHLLLGSRFDEPLDPFWTEVYRACEVPPERVFAMRPVVEDLRMRPYFNAGILAVRPDRCLFRSWYESFVSLYQTPAFQAFYQQDERYAIFMHQAVLSGVVLRLFEPEELLELPASYNYPVHLFDADDTSRRPASLDELVTFRHEGFYKDPDWEAKMPASDSLKRRLAARLAEMPFL